MNQGIFLLILPCITLFCAMMFIVKNLQSKEV